LRGEKAMTIREQLLKMGMQPEQIDNHCSDLYVLKNEISTEFVNNYEFKSIVTKFRSEIDGLIWYEIPFAYTEYYEERNRV